MIAVLLLVLAGLAVWAVVAVAVGLLLGPVLARSSRPCPEPDASSSEEEAA